MSDSEVSWPSYMKLAQANAGIIRNEENTDKTKAQKEYQNKLVPKHYLENLKQMRVEKFELYESEDAQKLL